MPTLDEFEIPAARRAELLGIVEQAKAGPLLALAQKGPALGRGFRPTVAVILQRNASCRHLDVSARIS